MPRPHTATTITAILSVLALDATALALGYDGWLLGLALGTIGGIAGYETRRRLE